MRRAAADGDGLSVLDRAFLELEDAVPAAHMHLGAVLVLDPRPGGGPDLAALRERVRSRIDAVPRFDERLSLAHVDGLRVPRWVPDHGFRIARHVRRAALPDPGDARELERWCGTFFSQPLDRARPLWEVVLVERLAGGGTAIAVKLHHCLADGVGALSLAEVFADGAAAAQRPPAPATGPQRSLPVEAVETAARALLHPDASLRAARAAAGLVREGLLGHGAASVLNGPVGPRRSLTSVELPLSELRRIESALGGTVNDAALALVAGGLRRLLRHRGDPLPDDGVCAMVPVDVRGGEGAALGNRISSIFVRLPVALDGATARHAAIRAATSGRKRGGQAGGVGGLVRFSALVPPLVHQQLVRRAITPRLFGLTVTNVRGPERRLSILGARLRTVIPVVPLGPEHRIGVALISHAGTVTFGLVADEDAIPDVDLAVVADGMRAELAALRRAARRVSGASAAAASARRRRRRAARATTPTAPAGRR